MGLGPRTITGSPSVIIIISARLHATLANRRTSGNNFSGAYACAPSTGEEIHSRFAAATVVAAVLSSHGHPDARTRVAEFLSPAVQIYITPLGARRPRLAGRGARRWRVLWLYKYTHRIHTTGQGSGYLVAGLVRALL